MLKQAFGSYLLSLHPRNIKKLKSNNGGFWLIYWAFIYPIIISGSNPNFAEFMWFTMVKMIPFFVMGWSNLSSKFLMPKAMFLCPMKEEDRREYINAVLIMKIGLPVILGILIELVWSAFFGFHPWQILTISFIHFSIGIATYICFDAPDKNHNNVSFARKDKNGNLRWAWMNIVSLIIGVILLAGLELVDMTFGMTLGSGIAIGVTTGILLILDILILITQYKCTVENAGNYELTFRVLSKVPTNDNVEFDIFKR